MPLTTTSINNQSTSTRFSINPAHHPQPQAHSHAHSSTTTTSLSSSSSHKTRKLTHLQAQLAQLSANLSDLENLIGITSVQGEDMAFLGGYVASLFMSSSRVLGEEMVSSSSAATGAAGVQGGVGKENVDSVTGSETEVEDEGLSAAG